MNSKFIFILNILLIFFLFKKIVFKNKVEKFTNEDLLKKIYNVNNNLDKIFENIYSDTDLSTFNDKLNELDTQMNKINNIYTNKLKNKIKRIVYSLYD